MTIHDTATDGSAPFDANAPAKAASATPLKRPENGVFRPDGSFGSFYFTATGDTNANTEAGTAHGGFGAVFHLSQDPCSDAGSLRLLFRGDVAHTAFDNIQFTARNQLAVVEDAGDLLHTQRNALDSGFLFDVNTDCGTGALPTRFLAQGRDPSATIDSACPVCGNDGDNEITGIHASNGDPSSDGVLGAKAPKLFHDGWRLFYTRQHGDNVTFEIIPNRPGSDDGGIAAGGDRCNQNSSAAPPAVGFDLTSQPPRSTTRAARHRASPGLGRQRGEIRGYFRLGRLDRSRSCVRGPHRVARAQYPIRSGAAMSDTSAGPGAGSGEIELTILMPCLNEAETVGTCVEKARRYLYESGVAGEVLVADNGSTDGSGDIATQAGARVVSVPQRGNGAALVGGIQAARGKFVIMGDADDSYDFLSLGPFLADLRDGADLVMGNRFKGGIAPGAMPRLHRYLGNPFFSYMGRLFFGSKVRDFHCGLRGFRRDKFGELGIASLGFEFCSEMVIKAAFKNWRVTEVPTTLSPDGRSRAPHLKTWRDGLRHLRFFLLFSPRWLFLYPGALLALIGLVLGALVTAHPRGLQVGSITLDIDSLVAASGMVIVGYQAALFAGLTKLYASEEGFSPAGPWTLRVRAFRLEWGLLISALLFVAGAVGMVASLLHWRGAGFGQVDPGRELRMVVPSVTALVLGVQTAAASLFASILGIRHGTPVVESSGFRPGEQLPDPASDKARR